MHVQHRAERGHATQAPTEARIDFGHGTNTRDAVADWLYRVQLTIALAYGPRAQYPIICQPDQRRLVSIIVQQRFETPYRSPQLLLSELVVGEWLTELQVASCAPRHARQPSTGQQAPLTGWRVLDAGCSGGSVLPLIAAEVGPTGHLTALDLAPENIATVEQQVTAWALECPVSTHVGSFLDLPFADDGFDAVWCANSSQYLIDDELRTTLAEFRRVVRPGGLVAIKEANGAIWNYALGDPGRIWRFLAATRDTEPQIHGILRTPELRRWLEAAGFEEVSQRTTLIERWAPLRSSERQFHSDIFR